MKRQWQLQRQGVVRADGQLRWDRAYQLLLSRSPPPEARPAALPHSRPVQEVPNANSAVCARLDPAPSPDPDD